MTHYTIFNNDEKTICGINLNSHPSVKLNLHQMYSFGRNKKLLSCENCGKIITAIRNKIKF